MVKLHAYLLVLALATGSALAISVHYQRELDDRFTPEQSYGRELLEEREFALHFAKNLFKKIFHHGASNAVNNNNNNKRELNPEELFDRAEFSTISKGSGSVVKPGKTVEKDAAKDIYPHAAASVIQNRAFEDDPYLSGRDLDPDQLFGREYDLEAREPLSMSSAFRAARAGQNAAAKHQVGHRLGQTADFTGQVQTTFQNRGFQDNEDLFKRSLDAQEQQYAQEHQYSVKNPSAIHYKAATRKTVERGQAFRKNYIPSLSTVSDHLDKASDMAQQVQGIASALRSLTPRGFEDDKELFRRDLDTEELFGREYDLEAREPMMHTVVNNLEKADDSANQAQEVVNTIKSRGFEDDILWTGI